jgi:iron complex transport system ATP-binding protein
MTLMAADACNFDTPLALKTNGLAVGYKGRSGSRTVLAGLELSVSPGELVCLLGPNGIGKSTLLRTLAKMQPALAGGIALGGCDLQTMTRVELAKRLGVVLTERLTVGALLARQIVELGRYPHSGWFGGLGRRDRDVVHWAIDAVGAGHLADREYNTLSDGERQRVMIARALAQEPVMLLLDEPTAFLDVPSRVELIGLLRRLARDERVAVIVSTHDLELALRTADTVWLVTRDGLLHVGAPEDIVVAGHIEAAFTGDTICFRPEERTFRLLPHGRTSAVVHGAGLPALLAVGVLEREGYAIVDGGQDVVMVDADERGWTLSGRGDERRGDSYAALARCVREIAAAQEAGQ